MKRILAMMLTVALATMMSGCIQMHMDTEVKKDGSGTMEMTMSLSKVVTEAIAELGTEGMDDDLSGIDSMMDRDKKEVEKDLKGIDVDLVKYEKGIVDGRETVQVVLKFKDLENLSLALREVMDGDDPGMAILDHGDGNLVLTKYDYNWPEEEDDEDIEEEAEEAMDEFDGEDMEKQMAMMGKLMGAMGEMDISMKITVPGDVVESNAPLVEGRTSIWTINAENMMSGDTDMEPYIVFSGKGLKIKTAE